MDSLRDLAATHSPEPESQQSREDYFRERFRVTVYQDFMKRIDVAIKATDTKGGKASLIHFRKEIRDELIALEKKTPRSFIIEGQ